MNEDYVYFKYDKDGLFREGLFTKHCYNWILKNYESDDCILDIKDKKGNIHQVQFNPKTFFIQYK